MYIGGFDSVLGNLITDENCQSRIVTDPFASLRQNFNIKLTITNSIVASWNFYFFGCTNVRLAGRSFNETESYQCAQVEVYTPSGSPVVRSKLAAEFLSAEDSSTFKITGALILGSTLGLAQIRSVGQNAASPSRVIVTDTNICNPQGVCTDPNQRVGISATGYGVVQFVRSPYPRQIGAYNNSAVTLTDSGTVDQIGPSNIINCDNASVIIQGQQQPVNCPP